MAVETSGFLPVQAEDVRRWVMDEDSSDETAWARRLRAELRRKRQDAGGGPVDTAHNASEPGTGQ